MAEGKGLLKDKKTPCKLLYFHVQPPKGASPMFGVGVWKEGMPERENEIIQLLKSIKKIGT
jgi:hypothetical protein